MINALYANSNWDDEKNDRQARIREINENFDNAIDHLRNPKKRREEEIDWNDPWWSAAKRNLQKTRIAFGLEDSENAVAFNDELEERIRARQKSMRELDQSNGH